jgi:hypothetical protein
MPQSDRSWLSVYKRRRFAVLLALLGGILAGPPLLFGLTLAAGWFEALTSLSVFVAILSLCLDRRQRLFALLLGIPTILLSLGGLALSRSAGGIAMTAAHFCAILFFLGAAVLIVKSLFGEGHLTFDAILGAVCGYLFLGLGWAVIYAFVEGLAPGSFQLGEDVARGRGSRDSVPHVLTYYSFVTLTTVGYGDVIPLSPAARTFAWIEAIAGQFYLAVIVASLVGVLAANADKAIRARREESPE